MDIIKMLQNSENPCYLLVNQSSHIRIFASNTSFSGTETIHFFGCWNLCQPDLGNDCLNRNDSVVTRSTSKTLSCRRLPVAPVGPSAGPFGPVDPVNPKTVINLLKIVYATNNMTDLSKREQRRHGPFYEYLVCLCM